MLDEIENRTKEMKRKYKTADIAFDLLVLLECVIDTVDGAHLEASKVETFINNLPAMDMAKIVNSIIIKPPLIFERMFHNIACYFCERSALLSIFKIMSFFFESLSRSFMSIL